MNREAQAVLRDRIRTNRAAAKLRRRGVATLAGHCIAAGLRPKAARSAAGSLRRHVDQDAAVRSTSYSGRADARMCSRFTAAQVAKAAAKYRPRTEANKAARLVLLGT